MCEAAANVRQSVALILIVNFVNVSRNKKNKFFKIKMLINTHKRMFINIQLDYQWVNYKERNIF